MLRLARARRYCIRLPMAPAGRSAVGDSPLPPSKRIRATAAPCIVMMQKMLQGKEGVMSLAQGIVHWRPPPAVEKAVAAAATEADTHLYGADEGRPDLRHALMEKLRIENSIDGVDVMVTAGANQAFTNIVIALLDETDVAVLFKPFYFNHLMALQMTGGAASAVLGDVTSDFLPDIGWLESKFSEEGSQIRMVTVVNPCNPTGIIVPAELLSRIERLCAKHGAWLVVDNTYEHFTYEEEGHPGHSCITGDHVLNVFSFSKAYGMMGFRVGYIAYPPVLKDQLLKVQDTIAICPSIISQKAALAALSAGRGWVMDHVKSLAQNRNALRAAVDGALGPGHVTGGTGAIYLMVRLPPGGEDDLRVVEWLCSAHKVCVIPGSACGASGMVRLCYANLEPERCVEAAARLRAGLSELRARGKAVLDES